MKKKSLENFLSKVLGGGKGGRVQFLGDFRAHIRRLLLGRDGSLGGADEFVGGDFGGRTAGGLGKTPKTGDSYFKTEMVIHLCSERDFPIHC